MIDPDSRPPAWRVLRTASAWIALPLTAAAVGAARAETTFVLTTEFVSCVEVSWYPNAPGPGVNTSPCAPSPTSPISIGVFQAPGTSDFLFARHLTYFFSYNYTDDGLATGNASFESATLSFRPLGTSGSVSTAIDVFGAPADALAYEWGGPRGTAVVLGDNDHPDSFSGTLRLELHVTGGVGTASIEGLVPVLSLVSVPDDGVPPIPEPSTYALMLVGLAAMAHLTQRRRAAIASR